MDQHPVGEGGLGDAPRLRPRAQDCGVVELRVAGVHALQVEINRGLYLDEANLVRHEGFATLKSDLGVLFETLADALREGRL